VEKLPEQRPYRKKDVEVAKPKFKGQHEKFSLRTEGTNRKILKNNLPT
jgi:hypothetical protein